MSGKPDTRRGAVRGALVGYALALALTVTAFALVRWPQGGRDETMAAVFALGLAQMLVHFRCFLHIGGGRGQRDTLVLLLFSALIIALMVGGTLVLLMNLKARMM